MSRKKFMQILAEYLNKKKLKPSLGALYNAIIKYDMSKLCKDQDHKRETNDSENTTTLAKDTDEKQQFIWDDMPKTIEHCSMEQILWILNNDIFDNLNEKNKNNLISYQSAIVKYIQENKYDGAILHQMSRKEFMKILAEYLNNKKLKPSIGALYNAIIKYDMSRLCKETLSIPQYNANHIACIANQVIVNKVDKLDEYKQKIIQYIKENKIDGNKLKVEGKEFVNNITAYLNDNNLKGLVELLYNNIIEYDRSTSAEININEVIASKPSQSKSKFETKLTPAA
eukprot:89326_1